MFCAEHVVTPWLEKLGITYNSLEECYDDRINHRVEWYNAIRSFNQGDEARLSAAIFAEYDMYVGIRSRVEFLAAKHLSDLSIWVEAGQRVPQVDPTCKILATDCDIILDNNGTKRELVEKTERLFALILGSSYDNLHSKLNTLL
jgi:hypothetical protein